MIDGGKDLLGRQEIPHQRLLGQLRYPEADLRAGLGRNLIGIGAQRVDRVSQQDARDERQEAPFAPPKHYKETH